MASLDAALKSYEVLAALHALPDKASLTTAEAALFLRHSPKTMERMRLDGSGPPYIQGGAAGAKGGNQKCLYLKEYLLAWQKANQISNAMQAAVRKGQAFRTIFDLVTEEPFYVDTADRVAGVAADAPLNVVIKRLGDHRWEVVWLTPVDAASREWISLAMHNDFSLLVFRILDEQRQKISLARDATEIGAALRGDGV